MTNFETDPSSIELLTDEVTLFRLLEAEAFLFGGVKNVSTLIAQSANDALIIISKGCFLIAEKCYKENYVPLPYDTRVKDYSETKKYNHSSNLKPLYVPLSKHQFRILKEAIPQLHEIQINYGIDEPDLSNKDVFLFGMKVLEKLIYLNSEGYETSKIKKDSYILSRKLGIDNFLSKVREGEANIEYNSKKCLEDYSLSPKNRINFKDR